MSNRITAAMLSNTTLNDINTSLTALQRSEAELSSGKSILQPSDNPYGASKAIELQSQLDGLSSYSTNVQDGISWENASSGALSNINDITQRVRELTVQAANGVNNKGDLESIATEVEQLTEAVKQDANTQYNGQYVFAGTATGTPPYKSGETDTYEGDNGALTRVLGPGVSLQINTNISTLLGSGQGAADGKLLDTLRTITQDLRSGSTESMNSLASTGLKSLDANLETLTQLEAGAGSVTDQLQMASARIEDLQGSITQTLSGTEDTDFAKASLAYSNQQAAYDAALRAGASIVQESLLNFLR
jgi:flagellar hook-associated protein 3 FlgL